MSLYKLRVQFPLATIDSALDELKATARPHGEIITYLPTGGGSEADAIELEILIASREPMASSGASSRAVGSRSTRCRGARSPAARRCLRQRRGSACQRRRLSIRSRGRKRSASCLAR